MKQEEFDKKNLSRREFLKGAGVSVAALAGSSVLTGCKPKAAPAEGEATDTPAAGGTYSFETPPEPIADKDITETVTADVVVVGAGDAGLAATLAAAEAGASVILLEKSASFNSRGFGNGALDTKYHKEQGIELDKGAIVNDLVEFAGAKVDQAKIELWADHSGEVYDHLIDLATEAELPIMLFPAGQDPEARYFEYPTCLVFGSTMQQADLLSVVEAEAIKQGADIRYEMTAQQLVQEDDGTVSGVIVTNAAGEYVKFVGEKGVILATGDYGHNEEMMDKWCSWAKNVDMNVYVPAVNTGDGHKMGLWAGGQMEIGPHAPMIHTLGGGTFSMNPVLRVNGKGLRYENEDIPNPYICNSRLRQPGNVAYAIFDSNYAEYIPNTIPGFARTTAVSEMTAETLASEVESGAVLKADTLEDLAEQMGVPADNFVATVERYTELALAGEDEDFHKNPRMMAAINQAPFYASKVFAVLLVTLGGFRTNTDLQVLDDNFDVIPGLYAAGNVSGGFYANDYPVLAAGLSHGRCITEGYLAGKHAANA